jgi:DNA-binding NtrC family response regulator
MNDTIRVLIVDDDELVSDSIAAFLEDEGFQVGTVSTAEEALVLLTTSAYHVCITDFTLPGMDGETLIIRAHVEAPQTSFIMHSGINFVPTTELLQTGFSSGNVMSKPIMRLDLLTLKIRQLAAKAGTP